MEHTLVKPTLDIDLPRTAFRCKALPCLACRAVVAARLEDDGLGELGVLGSYGSA